MSAYKPPADVTPQTAAFMTKVAALGLPSMTTLPVREAREQMERAVAARDVPPLPVADTRELRIPGPAGLIPARLYRPRFHTGSAPGLLVYYHGGGHVIGSLYSHDASARGLCHYGQCAVLSIDYRMAPEDVFPAAVEDCQASFLWAAENAAKLGIDAARMAVGGDSAGGNLAAVVALMARDAGGPAPRLQVLIYPLVDYRCAGGSYERFGKGYGVLEAETMYWFRDHYLGQDAALHSDWRASPLLAESLAGVAPATIIVAGCDPLRDEGRRFAARLIDEGVSVDYREYAGVLHGFFSLTGIIDEADEANRAAGRALAAALSA